MKKVLAGVLVFGATFSGSAFADDMSNVLARLDAIEKENTAIRRENAALLENKKLREQNAKLKTTIVVAAPSQRISDTTAPVVVPASAPPATAEAPIRKSSPSTMKSITASLSSLFGDAEEEKKDPFGAYAADLPIAYKAIPPTPGQFRIWGEGGAIWTGGDTVKENYALSDFTGAFGGFGLFNGGNNGTGIPGQFNLTPKIGWEAATGFDYRFANSPYHISGQFRYGEGGKTTGSASTAGTVDLAALAAILGGGGNNNLAGASIGGTETFSAAYKESHWLADLAFGRDMLGSGPDAMQLKGGLRISEFVSKRSTLDNTFAFFNFPQGINIFGPMINTISATTVTSFDQRNSFLGAGPRIGVEGTVPFAGKWGFEYLGDAALLFGTQKSVGTTMVTQTISPAVLALLAGGNGSNNPFSNERFATVFNADLQFGLSYWITPNVKMTGSYRLDAWINVQNQSTTPVTNLTPDRYTHGPRVTVTGQFAP